MILDHLWVSMLKNSLSIWMTLNANDFFPGSFKHNFRKKRFRCLCLIENLKYFKAIMWKYVAEWREKRGLTADIKHCHPSQIFSPTREPTDALKTATKINIPEKIPSRVYWYQFSHSCMHAFSQWKLKMEIIC